MSMDNDIQSMQGMWMVPTSAIPNVEYIAGKYRLKHGKFAAVPMICKAEKCPYFDVCTIDPQYRIAGCRCLMEIASIMSAYEQLCSHFGIDISEPYIKEKDLVDAEMIRDLVDIEVQIMRADNRMALSSDILVKSLVQIDNKGKPYYENIVNPLTDYKLKLQDRKYKILQLLNSTRKDKADMLKSEESLTNKTKNILDQIKRSLPTDFNLDDVEEDSTADKTAE